MRPPAGDPAKSRNLLFPPVPQTKNSSLSSFPPMPRQPPNLPQVMPSVDKMELPPLGSGERPQNRMVQQFPRRPELLLALTNSLIHLGDFPRNFCPHHLRRQPARTCHLRRFPARGHVSESQHDQCAPALLPGRRSDQRPARGSQPFESLAGPGVAQVEMLQDLGGAPFSRPAQTPALRGHGCDCRRELVLKFLETGVHSVTYVFRRFG